MREDEERTSTARGTRTMKQCSFDTRSGGTHRFGSQTFDNKSPGVLYGEHQLLRESSDNVKKNKDEGAQFVRHFGPFVPSACPADDSSSIRSSFPAESSLITAS
jgi:hypothetical protein